MIRGEPGAFVVVTSARGDTMRYEEAPLERCLVEDPGEWDIENIEVEPTCYVSPASAGRFVQPGEEFDLEIRPSGGGLLRGRTVVPGDFSFVVPAVQLDAATFSATCFLPGEPFTLTWTRSAGAWAYISGLRLSSWGNDLREQGVEVPDPLELLGVSVSAADTSLLFPANLGLFQRFDLDQRILLRLQQGLPVGNVHLVIMAADRNYTNWVRGGRFNPSGNIRGSSIVGDGVGMFGSLVALSIRSPLPPVASPPGGPISVCPIAPAG